mmetsp:Transcript_123/g.507  ORF Transcript_123/g.507 Transcript_123/m.507 type:complete len:219 (+) Transcript_123:1068-1724(+)
MGLPRVMVPVLSKTTASTPAMVSNTSPPRNKTPFRAPSDVATSTAVGVANPSAQGHATTSTSVANLSGPIQGAAPNDPASMSAPGNKASPASVQNPNVAALMPMTPNTNGPAMASASLCTGAARPWASSIVFVMPATMDESPLLDAFIVNGPSKTPVPALTLLSFVLYTNTGSPVSVASSTPALPATTTPSTGIISPGFTRTKSPGCTAARSTVSVTE